MRRLTWLFGLPFAAVVVLFALSNRETVVLALWPFLDGVAMPLFLAVLLPLIAGFFLGKLHQRLKRRRTLPKPLSLIAPIRTMKYNPVYCALDTTEVQAALSLAQKLSGLVGGLKLGLEFFNAHGPDGVRRLSAVGLPIFLDLKLHDIPNTVAGALRAILPLGPALTTLHASGGLAMMQAAKASARDHADKTGQAAPALLAVTVLTSLGDSDLHATGVRDNALDQVKRLAALAQQAGMDGVICSAHEVTALRAQCGPDFRLVVPGIRPAWAETNDQARVMTPLEAMQAGADHLVIGRPITAAADSADAARRIQFELDGAA